MTQHLCNTCSKRGTTACYDPCHSASVREICKDFSRGTTTSDLLQMHAASEVPLMNDEQRQKQVGGSHYKDHKFQPWDIILEYKLDYWEGNALKYLLRRKSDRLEDLKKAKHYIEECIRQRGG